MKKRCLHVLFILIPLSVAVGGCLPFLGGAVTYTASAITIVEALSRTISAFEASRVEASATIASTTQSVKEMLDTSEPDLKGASEAWESTWKNVHPFITQLEADFDEVSISSGDYFKLLNELEGKIANPQFQEAEKRRNEQLRAAWDEAYNEAVDDIKNLKQLVSDGDDLQLMLIAGVIRARLEQNIGVVDSISRRAQDLLNDLQQLTIEGRKLTDRLIPPES